MKKTLIVLVVSLLFIPVYSHSEMKGNLIGHWISTNKIFNTGDTIQSANEELILKNENSNLDIIYTSSICKAFVAMEDNGKYIYGIFSVKDAGGGAKSPLPAGYDMFPKNARYFEAVITLDDRDGKSGSIVIKIDFTRQFRVAPGSMPMDFKKIPDDMLIPTDMFLSGEQDLSRNGLIKVVKNRYIFSSDVVYQLIGSKTKGLLSESVDRVDMEGSKNSVDMHLINTRF